MVLVHIAAAKCMGPVSLETIKAHFSNKQENSNRLNIPQILIT
jgi:hypothetical protein